MRVARSRKVVPLTLKQVAVIVGLTPSYIRRLERGGRFPKRLSDVGRPRWSKLKVYVWLRRWGVRSNRKRK